MVTIKDIAEHAGVSKSLVSRYINNQKGVSQKSGEKIQAAITKLNYRPNAIARSLVKQQTGVIGVVVDDICSAFIYPLINEIENYIDSLEKDYDVIFCNANNSVIHKEQHIHRLTQGRVDGLIIYGSFVTDDDLIRNLVNSGFPFVLVENDLDNPKINKVVINNRSGARAAVELMLSRGLRNVIHLMGNPEVKISYDRKNGYLDALETYGIEYKEGMIRIPDFSNMDINIPSADITYKREFFAHGYQETKKMIETNTLPEGLFCASDITAFGAIKALEEHGLKVPDDISIVGFDNENPYLVNYNCDLITTVRQPLEEVGRLAAKRIIECVEAPYDKAKRSVVETELIVRNSTK